MSKFYFGSSSPSPTNSSADEDDLPYPTPLPRSAFLTPDFTPTTYLSSLRNRHQTLEDLRSELRTRSQELSKELLDLVNDNYTDFLNLGTSLKGGEEKVEEVRVGVLGFRREVETIKGKVAKREREMGTLMGERKELRGQIMTGRSLLDVAERLDELEAGLLVGSAGKQNGVNVEEDDYSDSEESEDDESNPPGFIPPGRLQKHAEHYLLIQSLIATIGPQPHPYLIAQQSRLTRIRNTLLLDLATALKQRVGQQGSGQDGLMRLMGIYRDLGEGREAIEVLRNAKS
ncbi:MAG: hypothetical protein M1817_000512 [Caeruleum heppii]|nr:MAG: hypothetical protein M1817_000512 [Caeruleum heppii]